MTKEVADINRLVAALESFFVSPNVPDDNLEAANLVDTTSALARAIRDAGTAYSTEWHKGDGPLNLVHIGAEIVRQWDTTNSHLGRIASALERLTSEETP